MHENPKIYKFAKLKWTITSTGCILHFFSDDRHRVLNRRHQLAILVNPQPRDPSPSPLVGGSLTTSTRRDNSRSAQETSDAAYAAQLQASLDRETGRVEVTRRGPGRPKGALNYKTRELLAQGLKAPAADPSIVKVEKEADDEVEILWASDQQATLVAAEAAAAAAERQPFPLDAQEGSAGTTIVRITNRDRGFMFNLHAAMRRASASSAGRDEFIVSCH